MRYTKISILALAVLMYSAPVFAQHGHAGGMGATNHGSMGSANHANTNGATATPADQQKIDNILKKNSAISGKLQTLTGMPAQQACTGFKNLGQCVAAAHVSKNLGIPFACLRADMTGQAPSAGSSCPAGTAASAKAPMSLGKAIQILSPNANSKLEAKKAQKQADRDIQDSGSNS
jgi:hypothetical protein